MDITIREERSALSSFSRTTRVLIVSIFLFIICGVAIFTIYDAQVEGIVSLAKMVAWTSGILAVILLIIWKLIKK